MTGSDLKSAAIELYGERGWISALASALHVDRTQVWRYVNARTPVPGPVQAAVECWLDRRRETQKSPASPNEGGGA